MALQHQRRPMPTNSAPSLKTDVHFVDDPNMEPAQQLQHHRAYQIDISLATEIDQTLVSKIRAMQIELQRHQEMLSHLRSEKLEVQRRLDALTSELAVKNENEGIYTVLDIVFNNSERP